MEIIPNVHQISLGFVNAFLVVEEDGLTVIDTGMSRKADKIVAFIESIGRKPEEIKTILITHADADHVGGTNTLKTLSGAAVAASQIEAKALQAGTSSRPLHPPFPMNLVMSLIQWLSPKTSIPVDQVLSPGQTLPILSGLEVIATPGHTPGHISLFAKESGVLFAGDSLITEEDKIILNNRKINTWDKDGAFESTKRQEDLAPEIVCVGHGPVVKDASRKFPV